VYPDFLPTHESKGWTRVPEFPEFLPARELDKAIESMPWLHYYHKKDEEVPGGKTK
jgi:hypothetical protein